MVIENTDPGADLVEGIVPPGSLVNSVVEPVGRRPHKRGSYDPEMVTAERSDDLTARARSRHSLLDERPFAGSKILVVDDDSRNVFAMSVILERGHGEVTTAVSGADALAALRRSPDIQLVLMDIMMPGMDGYATMRAIRAMEQFSAVPILAVTARVVQGERARCIDAGANDYVPKPVNTAELIAAIGPWLRPQPRT